MPIKLFAHQQEAVDKLRSGSILCGSVGSGKSITSLYYYFVKECKGVIEKGFPKTMDNPKDLYIITTARKRDTLEWDNECIKFGICCDPNTSISKVKVTIDSWNNIHKYKDVINGFFIFDEQRLVGYGAWVKSFLRIAKYNHWILLSATPGDRWSDYIPVFVANGFYKNKTEFDRKHVIYRPFVSYPQISRYVGCDELARNRDKILVDMKYYRTVTKKEIEVTVGYDRDAYKTVQEKLWDPFNDCPIRNKAQYCFTIRKIVNSDSTRVNSVLKILKDHPRSIIFYSYDYELEILRKMAVDNSVPFSEWNGHKHESILKEEPSWVYLVQYNSGSEGWNCTDTDTIIFYSQQYSYRTKIQSMGRIDRINTPFSKLFYYSLISKAPIDYAISRAITQKRDFNENFDIDFDLAEKTWGIMEGRG